MKKAKDNGFGQNNPDYECLFAWPDDCFVQCGGRGIVFRRTGSYRTAFFEAFPKEPDCFIRGEGETIADAERSAWERYRRIVDCPGHEFERGEYRNGSGTCKHCQLFQSDVFEPLEKCTVCSIPTYWTSDIHGNWYCRTHKSEIPIESRRPEEEDLLSLLFK